MTRQTDADVTNSGNEAPLRNYITTSEVPMLSTQTLLAFSLLRYLCQNDPCSFSLLPPHLRAINTSTQAIFSRLLNFLSFGVQ